VTSDKRVFTVSKVGPRAFRWEYRTRDHTVSNSLTQHGARECKSNLQDIVFWVAQKVSDAVVVNDISTHELLARGGRTRWLLIVPFIGGWSWRLHDGRKVFFQPVMERGLDDEIEALLHFEALRAEFGKLDLKATRKVNMP
jgi:hypothetical protein